MSKKVIHYSNREEWLQGRSNGIGASEVGTVLGLNPFETPYQLWRRKKGIDPPKAETFAMKAGHYLEDAVARFYADESQCQIIKATTDDFTILDPDRPYLRVSPDRLYWRYGVKHNERSKSVLECKTTQMQVDADNLPKHWFCQLQMNMGVGEYEDGALAWLTMGREFGYRDIQFDRDFYGWMVDEVTEFWQRYIVGNQVPEITSVEDVMLKYPRHTAGKTIVANDAILDTIKTLRSLKTDKGIAEKHIKELEEELKVFISDAETLEDEQGNVLATWKAPKPSTKFNIDHFKAEFPKEYDLFCEPYQGARRLLVK